MSDAADAAFTGDQVLPVGIRADADRRHCA
jgi:hypothetical protein